MIPARLVRVATLVSEETEEQNRSSKIHSHCCVSRNTRVIVRVSAHRAGGGRATDVQVSSSAPPSVRPLASVCARATLRFRGEWSPNGERDDEDGDDDAEEEEEVEEEEGRAG